MLKGQDMVVLAALMAADDGCAYAELGERAWISASEAYAAVRRLKDSGLLNNARKLIKANVLEFLVHGLKYAFPMKVLGAGKGMPTAYAAPVAADEFAGVGAVPVWAGSPGQVAGRAYAPFYPTAPNAAAANSAVYDRLALMDMLRGGRLRERDFATRKFKEILA